VLKLAVARALGVVGRVTDYSVGNAAAAAHALVAAMVLSMQVSDEGLLTSRLDGLHRAASQMPRRSCTSHFHAVGPAVGKEVSAVRLRRTVHGDYTG
jgi:hypothetical protein